MGRERSNVILVNERKNNSIGKRMKNDRLQNQLYWNAMKYRRKQNYLQTRTDVTVQLLPNIRFVYVAYPSGNVFYREKR